MLRNVNILSFYGILDSKCLISLKSASTSVCLAAVRNDKKCNISMQFARYTKPAWAHIAGTKLHRVTVRKVQPPEESNEFKEKFQHYRTIMKSLRIEFLEEIKAKEANNHVKDENVVDAGRIEYVEKMNNEWNKQSEELRKSLEVEDIKAKEQEFEDLKRELDEIKAARKAEARKQVEKVKKERSNFIDISRLDEAIEESLNKRFTFNFFIDKEGNRYVENLDGTISAFDKDGNPIVSEMPSPAQISDACPDGTSETPNEGDDSAPNQSAAP